MKITCDMLQAATRRAVELGVLPRRSQAEDIATNAEIMQEILTAAIEAVQEPESHAAVAGSVH